MYGTPIVNAFGIAVGVFHVGATLWRKGLLVLLEQKPRLQAMRDICFVLAGLMDCVWEVIALVLTGPMNCVREG